MTNRWIGIVALGMMLSVNTALLMRDVVPEWYAGTPPTALALDLSQGGAINVQLGLFNEEGRRIGYAWTRSTRDEYLIQVRHQTFPPVFMQTRLFPHRLLRCFRLREQKQAQHDRNAHNGNPR